MPWYGWPSGAPVETVSHHAPVTKATLTGTSRTGCKFFGHAETSRMGQGVWRRSLSCPGSGRPPPRLGVHDGRLVQDGPTRRAARRPARAVVGHPDAREHGGLAETQAHATSAGAPRAPARRAPHGERRLGGRLALSARGTVSSGLVQVRRGWWSTRLLLGLETQAQGMPDDLMATGLEADARRQRIARAVEVVAQGDGDTHRQDAGGLVSLRTSSGHGGPPRAMDSEKTGVQWEYSTEEFLHKIFFVNRKTDAVSHCSGLCEQSAARSPRRGRSRVCQEDAPTIGCEADAMRQLGWRSALRYGLGPV